MMHRTRVLAFSCAVALAAVLAIPSTAFAVLQNEYGMKYAGQQICTSCHELSYGETTHGRFAKVGADPSADYMWPAGRNGVGEMLLKSQVAFTLGAGTGLREYLVNNEAGSPAPSPVEYTEIQGTDRYLTAVEASKKFGSAATVVVATGETFPDALGGAALAGAVNGPLLLT
ncbi:MAG: cell wall-binding repeat-containing protein, partial [Actinomycetia bacterium]|nr:cell wall-binding repeat-containing protein [Actinomycetes bacterium]